MCKYCIIIIGLDCLNIIVHYEYNVFNIILGPGKQCI